LDTVRIQPDPRLSDGVAIGNAVNYGGHVLALLNLLFAVLASIIH
jgi:hypothetical protein